MNLEYNAGHEDFCQGRSMADNPYRADNDPKKSVAWLNGWKDASQNSAARGFDPTREYVEPIYPVVKIRLPVWSPSAIRRDLAARRKATRQHGFEHFKEVRDFRRGPQTC